MPKIKYQHIDLKPASLALIAKSNEIITEYTAAGFTLTLRQLYYQLVSRAIIPNKQQEYKRLGSIINDARLAGLIDWEAIEDRTRNVRSLSHWNSPEDILGAVASQYAIDKWADQEVRPEVWIEKDALVGVIEDVCQEHDVSFFSCRGYTSQSEMWGAAQRFIHNAKRKQNTLVIHLGDHDPSGIDMSRDIEDRIRMFMCQYGTRFELRRVALNFDQVEQYEPPPNPAKMTDSRFEGYAALHGDESWELDALEPQVIANLIRTEIESVRDENLWADKVAEEDETKAQLSSVRERWDEVADFLGGAE